jgi:bacterioferritin-associated ferredoxin
MFICLCKGIKESEFSALALRHGTCPEAMKRAMGLDDSCCGRCEPDLETMIQRIGEGHARRSVRTLVYEQEARSFMFDRSLSRTVVTMEDL